MAPDIAFGEQGFQVVEHEQDTRYASALAAGSGPVAGSAAHCPPPLVPAPEGSP
jgi:hypothetical protein